jgi:hypothetical protein
VVAPDLSSLQYVAIFALRMEFFCQFVSIEELLFRFRYTADAANFHCASVCYVTSLNKAILKNISYTVNIKELQILGAVAEW